MIEFFFLAFLAMAGLAVAAIIGFVLFLIKFAICLVLLPIKILFKLLWIPVGLALGAFGLLAGAVALPFVLLFLGVVAVIALGIMLLGLALPAIPFVLLGLLIWAMFRKRPVVAV